MDLLTKAHMTANISSPNQDVLQLENTYITVLWYGISLWDMFGAVTRIHVTSINQFPQHQW